MDLRIEGPLDEYNYEWKVINSSVHMKVPTSVLYIQVNYSGQYFDFDFEKITLFFNDSTQIVDSINSYEMVDTAIDFYLKGKETHTPLGYWIGLSLFVVLY